MIANNWDSSSSTECTKWIQKIFIENPSVFWLCLFSFPLRAQSNAKGPGRNLHSKLKPYASHYSPVRGTESEEAAVQRVSVTTVTYTSMKRLTPNPCVASVGAPLWCSCYITLIIYHPKYHERKWSDQICICGKTLCPSAAASFLSFFLSFFQLFAITKCHMDIKLRRKERIQNKILQTNTLIKYFKIYFTYISCLLQCTHYFIKLLSVELRLQTTSTRTRC